VWVILVLALAGAGCMTKSRSEMQAREAYLEGQNAALKQMQASRPGVTVNGAVQHSFVPWVVGLTLAQAIATADYIGPNAPKEIIITRNGERATVAAKTLLSGTEIPLQIGDVIELR
jgi:protein involved in polysaccharide export with SLBB domain